MTIKTLTEWETLAATLAPHQHAFIDGKFVDSASGKTFDCVNPATGSVICQIAEGDAEDIDLAVAAARLAFESGVWSGMTPRGRKEILLRLAELILENQAELAALETLDMGKPIGNSYNIDIPGSAYVWQWYAEAIDKVYDEIAPTAKGDLAMVRREPLGVIGVVTPWNSPFNMATWKAAPALAAGNSIVLKPAEQSPLTALKLAELAAEAGIPDGVFNVVPGFGHTAGKALGLHMDVDCLGFTGSTEVGKYFFEYSGQSNMKPIWAECGGKGPNIVFADVSDLDAVADMAAEGVFFNQGEICSANSRLLVERPLVERLTEMVVERAAKRMPGNPFDPATKMGAIVDSRQTDRIMEYIETGRKEATLKFGGERVSVGTSDNFIMPTIFADVDNDMTIAREEIFGPVLAIIPFDDEKEAIRIANDTIYGLSASVWTNDLSRAHRLTDALRAGTVCVNTVDALSVMTPFGGIKQSGNGRDLSLHALDKYTALKTVWVKY